MYIEYPNQLWKSIFLYTLYNTCTVHILAIDEHALSTRVFSMPFAVQSGFNLPIYVYDGISKSRVAYKEKAFTMTYIYRSAYKYIRIFILKCGWWKDELNCQNTEHDHNQYMVCMHMYVCIIISFNWFII